MTPATAALLADRSDLALRPDRIDGTFPDVIDFGPDARPRRIRFIHAPGRSGRIERIVMHPVALGHLKVHMERAAPADDSPWEALVGILIITDEFMPIYATRWETTPHPWVAYDDADAAWSRPVGYGREVKDWDTLLGVVVRGLTRRAMEAT